MKEKLVFIAQLFAKYNGSYLMHTIFLNFGIMLTMKVLLSLLSSRKKKSENK